MERRQSRELIYRSRRPDNLEGPREVFEAALTPVEAFFVRNHFDVPQIDVDQWTLEFEGKVGRPQKMAISDLNEFEFREVRATIECAGNSRAHLGERAQGVPWRDRAIGTATWGGVSLKEILEEVGVDGDAVELVFVGADKGVVETTDGAQLEMAYARSLPRHKAMASEVLIATHMNGERLNADHGFPARLVVPGWYGMASVKWLTRVIAVDRRFDGYFQTEDYATWIEDEDLVVRRPIGAMAVKSHIGFPVEDQTLSVGETITIRGYAWGGESAIESVQISVDGGRTFESAHLEESDHRFAWRAWEYQWTLPQKPGRYRLLSQAHTEGGETQPPDHDWRRGAYVVNAMRPVEVNVVGQ